MGTLKYPIRGFAPGDYICICTTCTEKFEGDKRANQCERCALREEVLTLKGYLAEYGMAYIEAQKRSCGRHGYEPGQLQWAWRQGKETNLATLEDAICDALAMGGIAAHPGDGVGCASQIVTGYAEFKTKELQEALIAITLRNVAFIKALEPEFLGKLIYETWLKATDGPSWLTYKELARVAPDDAVAVTDIVKAVRSKAGLVPVPDEGTDNG